MIFRNKLNPVRKRRAQTRLSQRTGFSNGVRIELKKSFETRYGENPHQRGAFYIDPKNKDPLAIQNFKKIFTPLDKNKDISKIIPLNQYYLTGQGKEITFNNLLDIQGAIDTLTEIENGRASCVIIKHGNPCGAAYGKNIKDAFFRAWYKGDSLAAFGGIIGLNREVDKNLAEIMTKNFFDILVAPKIKKEALEIFRQKPKLLILANPSLKNPKATKELDFRKIRGGFLIQEPDLKKIREKDLKVVTETKPTEKQIRDLVFAWKIGKVSKSNALILVKDETLISSGVGQQDRKRACQVAVMKAGNRAKNCIAASDGFFPFPDGPEILIKAGVKAIIQPGGSIKDKDVIAICNQYKIPMVFTGIRAFKH